MTSRRRGRGDDGSSDALGLALIAPAMIGLAIVILFLGRQVDNRATLQIAAETGAQAAAQARTIADAKTAGASAAKAMMVGTSCTSPTARVDTRLFRPGGRVSVTVSCGIATNDLELINPPDVENESFTAFAVIDEFRAAEGEP